MTFNVSVAQINPTVGDIDGNLALALRALDTATVDQARLLVLPELALSGYPPEDLLLRSDFLDEQDAALRVLTEATTGSDVVVLVGFAERVDGEARSDSRARHVANSVAVLAAGEHVSTVRKRLLPDYGVFDETRWFQAGDDTTSNVITVGATNVGVLICEDLWDDRAATAARENGAHLLVVVNASPWHRGKPAERVARAAATGMSTVYVNQVGAQDGVVFDGRSFVTDMAGQVRWQAPAFRTHQETVRVGALDGPAPETDELADTWDALVLGVRDYVNKNGFPHVYLGLSGGIDSAVAAAVAADALGPDRVIGVLMPSQHSSPGSVFDADDLAERLGIRTENLRITDTVTAIENTLHGRGRTSTFGTAPFADTAPNVAEENIQARARGLMLMALANKFGGIVLTTGNKSEMAVGYCTLYGDMAGGFAVLADVPKTLVWELARWRNTTAVPNPTTVEGITEPIPESSITKPPSAELAPGQNDTDSLPPYDLLDAILDLYVDTDLGPDAVTDVIAATHQLDPDDTAATVDRITRLVDRNEYKRRQSAPGVRVTEKAFGRDRRLPITNQFRPAQRTRT